MPWVARRYADPMTSEGQGAALIRKPLDAANLRPRVQAVIDSVLHQQGELLASVSTDMEPLVSALSDLLSGGKRLRPAFAYWGWRGAAGDEDLRDHDDAVIHAVTGLEFLQACALIHDDVMDGSDTRRGLPAAHRRFAGLHRGEQWLGSPESFGVGAAILLGDLCLSWADEVLLTADLPREALIRAKATYDEMRSELMAGQYLDLLEQACGGGSVDRALKVVRYKSAKYTIERPLHIGAALAGAREEVTNAYSGYGLPLGEAFQLRDDVLGVFGDPEQTGKPAGDDLREGKRTVLIAVAVERADDTQRGHLRALLGDPGLDAAGITTLRTIIEDTGALAHTEQMIDALLQQAINSLTDAAIANDARDVLTGLAYAATRRSV